MKSDRKGRLICSILSIMLIIGNIISADVVNAKDFEIVVETGTASANQHGQEYAWDMWYHTIKSHLFANMDGTFTRAEFIDNEIVAETYNNEFVLQDKKVIPLELSVYGGIYYSKDNYFVVEGEKNYDEKEKIPEFRIIKYDKEWNRLAYADITDANTVEPFDFGTCRFSEYDGKLYIRTCHKMYKSLEDGKNHQANVMIRLDMDKCKVEAVTTEVANSSTGYVSHSFNQFTVNKNGILYACDHGDAYPRSFVIFKYHTLESGIWNSSADAVDVLAFTGAIGDNYTGATLGGFAVTNSKAIVVGSSMPQDGTVTRSDIRNIFVSTISTTDFSENSLETTWITDFSQDATETVSNPQLIAITDDRLLLIWETCKIDINNRSKNYTGKLQYVFLDGDGNIDGEIHSIYASLSDCEPIIVDNSLVWYVTGTGNEFYSKKQNPVFYKLPLDRTGVTDITLNKSAVSLTVGETIEIEAEVQPLDAYNQDIIWSSSNKSIATVVNGKVTAVAPGSTTITAVTKDGDKQAFCEVTVVKKEEVTYKASFIGGEDSSGESPADIKQLSGKEIKLPINTFKKENYNFTGWSDGETIYQERDTYIMPSHDVNFVAQWEEQGSKFKIGDLDGNGVINSADALIVLKIAAKLNTPTAEQEKAADVDGNGQVNSADALLILKYAAKLITEFS